jgi:hypothetical protein
MADAGRAPRSGPAGPGPRRREMDARFGPPGSGPREVRIGGQRYTPDELLARLGLAFEGCRALDAFQLGPSRYAVRYYDAEEQWVVACEFDGAFRYLGELRAHVAEWVGERGLRPGGLAEEPLPPWISR